MNIKDFHVGDKVIAVTKERDYKTGGIKDKIHEETIVSVGRKYVHATNYQSQEFTVKYSAEDYFPDGLVEVVNIVSPDTYLFKIMEDYNDYIKRKELIRYVSDNLNKWGGKLNNLTLEQLETIKEIIEGNKEENVNECRK